MSIYDRVVITGAGGMLGHALADQLRERGIEPIALDRASCDLADESHLDRLFDYRPTLVLNCAAHTKVDLCEQEPERANAINGYAVGSLAQRCKQTGAMLVHVSTDFVFPGDGTRPYRINDPVGPLSAYGRSKLLGETELQSNAPGRWLIVRTAWVYGRYGANFPRTMVTVAKAGKPLTVVCDQVGSPTYTVDLADGILNLIDADATGVFHLTGAGETNWCDFARAAIKQFGIKHSVGAITAAEWAAVKPSAAARPKYSVLDMCDYERVTGKSMPRWRDALVRFEREVDHAGGFLEHA